MAIIIQSVTPPGPSSWATTLGRWRGLLEACRPAQARPPGSALKQHWSRGRRWETQSLEVAAL